ncbi:hypothetical protein SAMN02927916_0008 [Flavobacterium anhuiense]|uniref:Lipocalin-like domain-containing protein n=1 Tax=Flavobacterium anhuiense TaxID=459526 RepID=A0ABY0M4Z3_9FLAO|nr:lipocalin family protein [Flavobacterium anhuiense]SCZ00231.1 hypothetical protein SAMN02927916_0008 [Flavobacterium anhuiense]
MIKFRFLTLLIVFFVSCSKDENPTPEPLTFDEKLLIKAWTYDTLEIQGTKYLYDHNPDCHKDYFVYKNNKEQVYQYDESFFKSSICSGTHVSLTWEPKGNHISFYFGTAKVDEYKVISLTQNLFIFTMERDVDNDGKKESVTITAIPYDTFNPIEINGKRIQNLKTFPSKLQLEIR